MKKDNKGIDYSELKAKTLDQLRSGKSLFGKDGALAPLLKDIIETALESEMDSFMDFDERSEGNRRNGYNKKLIKTTDGTIPIETPRDRNSDFEPQLISKRETIMADSLEKKILGLYGLGMSLRDISAHIKEMYDTDISASTLSTITDRIIPIVQEWQNRPLESMYCIVWLDAMYYKVKEDTRFTTRCIYNILGINAEGRKEILGCYTSESEGANFWLSVLTNLQNRGLEDILIACIDNLKGFAEAIETVYPKVEVQSCIIHQIRNSLKYVASKDQKEFMRDLKPVYRAVSIELAEQELIKLTTKWQEKYPVVVDSWNRNWVKLSTYFKYPQAIRKLIYTTNTIEGYHRQIRKVTKTKGSFTSDMALLKLIYLATDRIQQKWTMPLPNWSITVSQLSIIFGDRIKISL